MFDSIQQLRAGFGKLGGVNGTRLVWLLFGSYCGIIIAVLGSAVLMPELFFGHPHRGISFWGNYFPAVVPYAAGLLASAVCLVFAAHYIPDYPERLGIIRRLLWAVAAGLLIVLLTPEQANIAMYWAHTLAAVYLFVVGGLGVSWIMLHAGKTYVDWALFWMVVAGLVFSLMSASYIRLMGVLALGQVLALNGASLIIIRAVLRWATQEVKE